MEPDSVTDAGLTLDSGLSSGNDSQAPYFHNVRANFPFGLAADSIVCGRSYLALGSFSTIGSLSRGARVAVFGCAGGQFNAPFTGRVPATQGAHVLDSVRYLVRR